MKLVKLIVVVVITSTFLTSCVSTKKFNALDADMKKLQNDKSDCDTKVAKGLIAIKKDGEQIKDLQTQVSGLTQQTDSLKTVITTNGNGSNQLIKTLQDLNVLTNDQAQSLMQSLKTISANNESTETLKSALTNNLKNAAGLQSDTDITVRSDKGSLYIDLTDHMFFNSGSADLTPRAKMIMEKISKLLNVYPDMHFMIEGHTDNKPMHTACIPDNWDLSVRRASAVVRVLQKQYHIDPARMIAAGHGEYEPVLDNETPAHRAQNRRITIVMTAPLDQFFKLLEQK